MTAATNIQDGFWRWLALVAEGLLLLLAHWRNERPVCLQEGEHGYFIVRSGGGAIADARDLELHVENGQVEHGTRGAALAPRVKTVLHGSRIELLVRSDRFVFKPLELPSRAAEFLDGVVRAQIDRLTPWNADQAAFGFSAPAEAGPGRLVVTIAATAKAMLAPILQAFSALGARSVVIRVASPEAAPETPPITVLEENVARKLDVHLTRRILAIALAAALLIAATASIAASIVGGNLQARQDELAGRIARQRSAALITRDASDPRTLAEQALLRRKNTVPSDVIALEILSQILPDNTYVTEMRIEANKLQLVGITRDAPQLIRLIERTRHFSHATFFAPITHSPSERGDRFSIEALMEPNFSVTP